jgi:RNA polymerase sigma factor (sigma-70 family)
VTGFDRVARREARRVYLPGYDRDDVLQEARVALLEASYRPCCGLDEGAFATMVVRRRLVSRLRAAHRWKHQILTRAARDRDPAYEPDLTTRLEAFELVRRVARLPRAQRTRLTMVAAGYSYQEIAAAEGVSVKAVDTAVFEARRTLRGMA